METNKGYHKRGLTSVGEDTFGALQFARDGIENDEEQYDCVTTGVAQSSTVPSKGHVAVPEARPWYEWCRDAEDGVLDLCKRCGSSVSQYIQHCFDFARSFSSDDAVAYGTKLEDVFSDGEL